MLHLLIQVLKECESCIIFKLLTAELVPQEGKVEKHPNLRIVTLLNMHYNMLNNTRRKLLINIYNGVIDLVMIVKFY